MHRTEGFYVYYWYVVVSAVKESPNLYLVFLLTKLRNHLCLDRI